MFKKILLSALLFYFTCTSAVLATETEFNYGRIRQTTFVYDPPSLGTGNSATFTLTFTGAALGDVILISAPYDLNEVIVFAYVTSTNNIEGKLFNLNAGGAVDLASGTWTATLLRP